MGYVQIENHIGKYPKLYCAAETWKPGWHARFYCNGHAINVKKLTILPVFLQKKSFPI